MSEPKRTILITGAGSGLGRSLGLDLAQRGHTILATDLRIEGARETAAQIAADGGVASAHALDVTSEAGIERFVNAMGELRIDVLINNAGLQHVAQVESFPAAEWDLLMNVLLRGAFLLIRHC